MKKTLQRGFTLIELLVVIAIIGILAAVVLGSLNDARQGGQDASIKQTMTNVRSQAELYYNNAGGYSYTGVCDHAAFKTGIIGALSVVNAAADATDDSQYIPNGGPAVADAATEGNRRGACVSNANSYQATVPLADGSRFWCVDSTGASRAVAAAPNATDVVCPAS